MPEYEVEVHPDDSNSDDSAPSLDSEFCVPIIRTPEAKKALISTNEKLCLSSHEKTQVTRYAYNEYMAHHYAFAMKVAAKQEPERPSLPHRLEGENRPNHNRPNRRKEIREEPRNQAVKSRAPKPRKEAAKSRATELRRGAAQRRREEEPPNEDAKKAAQSREEKTQAEAQTSQLHTTQARTRIPQYRCESMRVEANLGYRPKPTQLELEGAC